MTDNHDDFERWLEYRRNVQVPEGFVDTVMTELERRELRPRQQLVVVAPESRTGGWMAVAQAARMLACGIAAAIGLLPFWYLAYFAQALAP